MYLQKIFITNFHRYYNNNLGSFVLFLRSLFCLNALLYKRRNDVKQYKNNLHHVTII